MAHVGRSCDDCLGDWTGLGCDLVGRTRSVLNGLIKPSRCFNAKHTSPIDFLCALPIWPHIGAAPPISVTGKLGL